MLSRHKLKPSYHQNLITQFYTAINKRHSLEEAERFMEHLLTPVETDTFAKRLEIFKELRKGSTYSEIGDKVKVTGATTAKMNNILRKADGKFLSFLDRLADQDLIMEKRKKESKYAKGSKQVYKKRIN